MIEYLIQINTYTSYDLPSIGMTNGVIDWTPNGYNTINPVDGLIGDKWVRRIFNGAKIDDGGGLAYTGGTTIVLLAQSQVYNTLKSLNIESGNKPLLIKMRDSYTGTETVAYRGIVAGIREDVDSIYIDVEDISRNRQSDSTYPYYLGEGQLIELEKNEVVSEVVEPLLRKSPLFYARTSSYASCSVLPYLVEPTATDIQNWVDSVNSKKQGSFFINGVKIPTFLSLGIVNEYYGLSLNLEYNINNSQGIIVDLDNITPVEITDRYNTYEADTYSNSGGFSDEILRYEDGSELGNVYSDEISFGTTSITSYEFDDIGYKSVSFLPLAYSGAYVISAEMKTALGIDGLFFINNGLYVRDIWYDTASLTRYFTGDMFELDYSSFDYSDIVVNPDIGQYLFAGNEIASVERFVLPPLDSTKNYYLNVSITVSNITIRGDINPLAGTCYNRTAIIGVGERSPSTGENYVVSQPVVIGNDYYGGGTSWDILATTRSTVIDNRFPLMFNKPNSSEEPFRWQADGEGLEDNIHGFSIPLNTIFGDIDLSSGGSIYLSTHLNLKNGEGIPAEENGFETIRIEYRNISIVEEVEMPLDPIYTKWDGRRVGNTLVTNTSQAYDLACRLQNLNDANVEKPASGWGTIEPTVSDWRTLINLSSDYGGIYNLPRTLLASVEDATNLKKDLAVSMVALGAVDDDGIENLYSLADGLFNTDGLLITYDDQLKPKEVDYKRYDQSRIYNEFDIGTVQVTDVDGNYNPNQSLTLWKMGNVLYRAYGIKKRYKKENYIIGNDAEKFPYDLMRWFGCYNEGNDNWVVRERGTFSLELPLSYAMNNHLFIGKKVRFEDSDGSIVSGIIYQREYDLVDKFSVKIEIHYVSSNTVSGGDTILIIETGSNVDTIVETGTNTDIIVEGQL